MLQSKKTPTRLPESLMHGNELCVAFTNDLIKLRENLPIITGTACEQKKLKGALLSAIRNLQAATRCYRQLADLEKPPEIRIGKKLLRSDISLSIFMATIALTQKSAESPLPFFSAKNIVQKIASSGGAKPTGYDAKAVGVLAGPKWQLLVPEKRGLPPDDKRYSVSSLAIGIYKKYRRALTKQFEKVKDWQTTIKDHLARKKNE